jgi:hypothetical protein
VQEFAPGVGAKTCPLLICGIYQCGVSDRRNLGKSSSNLNIFSRCYPLYWGEGNSDINDRVYRIVAVVKKTNFPCDA